MMSLVFGNLTQDFVTFGLAENNYYQSLQSNDASVIEQAQMALDTAASEFRHNAGLDASYLTYLGMFLNLRECIYLIRTRFRDVRLHISVHVRLGLYIRGQWEKNTREVSSGYPETGNRLF
jgi:hypothetical protein